MLLYTCKGQCYNCHDEDVGGDWGAVIQKKLKCRIFDEEVMYIATSGNNLLRMDLEYMHGSGMKSSCI